MSDSVDRVFAHAVNTVKRIPRTAGASRPPLADRLLLYGLYKQATEGDVPDIVTRPTAAEDEAIRQKWDAWHSQKGLSKTEAKRRYISSLIDNMNRYATSTPEARELVNELSFVWDQIKNQTPQQSSSSEVDEEASRSSRSAARMRRMPSRGEGLLELEPRSEESREWEGAVFSDGEEETAESRNDRRFRRRINKAIEGLRADVAALRKEMELSRTRSRRRPMQEGIVTIVGKWILGVVGFLVRHALFDAFIALLVWSYLYRRGDNRARLWGKLFTEWVRRRFNTRSRSGEIVRNRVSV